MTAWFTSDEHYGHKNIIKYCDRPFKDVAEMNEKLIVWHNASVRDRDIVYHIGDFAMDERLIPSILPRLNGAHFLVAGNHDKCHPMHKGHEAAKRRYLGYGFAQIMTRATLDSGMPYEFLMCHFPHLARDPGPHQRFADWRPEDDGRWLLHGHIHSPAPERLHERRIDVGVDAWDYTPVSIEQLVYIRAHALMA